MKKLLFLLLLVPSICFSETVNFAWDAVTQDTLGQPITVSGYKLYTSTTSGSYNATSVITAETQAAVTTLTAGHYFAVVTAYTPEAESDYSNEVAFTINGKPSTPQNFRLTSK